MKREPWEHYISCAVESKIIADTACPKDAETVFVVGIQPVPLLVQAFLTGLQKKMISVKKDEGYCLMLYVN